MRIGDRSAGLIRAKGRLVWVATAVLVLTWSGGVNAAPKWVLIYQRQLGNQINSGALTMETHVFRSTGAKAANVGVTNRVWPGTAIFGNTDVNGWNRVTFDSNNCVYDVTIFDPSTAKDYSGDFYWQNPAAWPYRYSYVTYWLHVPDHAAISAFPNAPVYHYDLINGMNRADGFNTGCTPYGWQEAPGADSDQRELASGGWSTYQAQTFVVPPGVNRIIAAQAWLTRSWQDPAFHYYASIHQGGPTGLQIGPKVLSPLHHSVNFKEETVCWPLDGVPVTAGQTYALRLEPTDGAGCNVWRTTADNYPGGTLWNGSTQVPGHDMIAVIVGVGYDSGPARIQLSRTLVEATAVEGNNVAEPHGFTVSNAGSGTMEYAITDDADWLSVAPASGSSTGEADPVNLIFAASGLNDGEYTATVTVDAPRADNRPQHVTVKLTVLPPPFAPCDFDQDGDVDLEDFGIFQACYSGPGIAQNTPACRGARLDGDDDVDLDDFQKFFNCLSGPGVLANVNCAD